MEREMEKWKKDRPSSTFDPRHRCAGYQMVWAVARQNQQTLEKMERERAHLSVPLTRSSSTLSLSPKRWRKGGTVSAGERKVGVRMVRHVSMGAKDEVNFKHSLKLFEQRKNKKRDLPNTTDEHSEEGIKDQIEQEEPRSTGMDKSLIRATAENKKQTVETERVDQTGNPLQPVEQTEMKSHSQSHNLERGNSKIKDQGSQKKRSDANTEQDIEESAQQPLGDTENLGTAAGTRPHSDTVTKETESGSQRVEVKDKQHSTETKTESPTQSAAKADGLLQTQQKQGGNTKRQDELEQSEQQSEQRLHSETEVGEILVSDDTVSESSETLVLRSKAAESTQEHDESLLTAKPGVEKEESAPQRLVTERSSDTTASQQDAELSLPGEKTSSVQMSPPKEPAPEPPKVLGTASEGKNAESLEESAVGKVFDSNKRTDSKNDLGGAEVRNSSPTRASSCRSSRPSADFCIRKSSSSQGSRLGRRLSEELFTVPQKPSQPQPGGSTSGVKHTERLSSLRVGHSAQSPPDVFSVTPSETDGTDRQQQVSDPPKGFRLFRKLRGQTEKSPKAAPKMQVPKILIQDFSDRTGTEKPAQEYKEEKLNSRERRRRKQEQDGRTKEEQKLRQKREKEKVMKTRKAEILGRQVGPQNTKERSDELHPVTYQSHRQDRSTAYAESYF